MAGACTIRTRFRRRLAFGVVAVLALIVLTAGPAVAQPAPELRNPDAKGRKLATEFVTIVQDRDIDELGAFLDPAFQIQRADGSGGNRKEYLARPTTIDTFELGPTVHAVQDGDLLTVRWSLKTSETITNEQYSEAEAPRLSVFRWDGRRWRLAAHANFNVPA